ncbi:Gypsy retrotransposon integrase-like protein 1, partial [Mucuna pruriens]
MVARLLKAGYYWSMIREDCRLYVYNCQKCQAYDPINHSLAKELQHVAVPWPFSTWSMDIFGPFLKAKRQVKFLLIDVDYFTKWIKVEPLA